MITFVQASALCADMQQANANDAAPMIFFRVISILFYIINSLFLSKWTFLHVDCKYSERKEKKIRTNEKDIVDSIVDVPFD